MLRGDVAAPLKGNSAPFKDPPIARGKFQRKISFSCDGLLQSLAAREYCLRILHDHCNKIFIRLTSLIRPVKITPTAKFCGAGRLMVLLVLPVLLHHRSAAVIMQENALKGRKALICGRLLLQKDELLRYSVYRQGRLLYAQLSIHGQKHGDLI